MLNKLMVFFFKKKIKSATGELTVTSKTKIFMSIEGLLRLVEFISPYFGYPVNFNEDVHKFLYGLAAISYAEREVTKADAKA